MLAVQELVTERGQVPQRLDHNVEKAIVLARVVLKSLKRSIVCVPSHPAWLLDIINSRIVNHFYFIIFNRTS